MELETLKRDYIREKKKMQRKNKEIKETWLASWKTKHFLSKCFFNFSMHCKKIWCNFSDEYIGSFQYKYCIGIVYGNFFFHSILIETYYKVIIQVVKINKWNAAFIITMRFVIYAETGNDNLTIVTRISKDMQSTNKLIILNKKRS